MISVASRFFFVSQTPNPSGCVYGFGSRPGTVDFSQQVDRSVAE